MQWKSTAIKLLKLKITDVYFLVHITWYQDLFRRNLSDSQSRRCVEGMEGSVGIVSDFEWPSRKGRCHTDNNYPKYSGIKARRVLKTLPNIPVNITEGLLKVF